MRTAPWPRLLGWKLLWFIDAPPHICVPRCTTRGSSPVFAYHRRSTFAEFRTLHAAIGNPMVDVRHGVLMIGTESSNRQPCRWSDAGGPSARVTDQAEQFSSKAAAADLALQAATLVLDHRP